MKHSGKGRRKNSKSIFARYGYSMEVPMKLFSILVWNSRVKARKRGDIWDLPEPNEISVDRDKKGTHEQP